MTYPMSNNAFEGKTVFITGMSHGIGHQIAKDFYALGAYVIGTSTNEEGVKRINEEFKDHGKGILLNLNQDHVEESIKNQLDNLDSVDILVNNAGVTKDNLLIRMNNNEWEEVMKVNLMGPFLLSRLFLKSMMKKRYGRIINISSVVALSGNPGQSNYAASKSGLIGLTKSLAKEMGSRNVTVNAVAPGFIDTHMTQTLSEEQKNAIINSIPLHRMGSVNDVSNVVLFLASDLASYITGTVINVNGGLYC